MSTTDENTLELAGAAVLLANQWDTLGVFRKARVRMVTPDIAAALDAAVAAKDRTRKRGMSFTPFETLFAGWGAQTRR